MSGRQPGAVPSIRRVTTETGRKVVLSVTAGKRRGESATYVGHHKATGDRLIIKRVDGGWKVTAMVPKDSPNRQYADDHGYCVLEQGAPTLSSAAEWSR